MGRRMTLYEVSRTSSLVEGIAIVKYPGDLEVSNLDDAVDAAVRSEEPNRVILQGICRCQSKAHVALQYTKTFH
jgi:hypothetical protein